MIHHLVLSFALGFLVLAVVPAHAQLPRPERPYRGLFGGGTGNWEQSLVANASIGGGWDDNLVADGRGDRPARPNDLNTSAKGGLGQFSGGLVYSLSRSRLSVNATAGTNGKYYPSLTDDVLRRDNALLGLALRLPAGFTVEGSAGYQPYSLSGIFVRDLGGITGSEATPGREIASSTDHYFFYGGAVSFNHRLSGRTSATADYRYRVRDSSRDDGLFVYQSAGGLLTFQVGRGLAVRAGYRYAEASYGTGDERPQNHLIDAGLDYSRSLSFSRRTTLSFSSGMSATSVSRTATTAETPSGTTKLRVVGDAQVNHEIGRTWNASLDYSRGVQFIETWPEPVFRDSLSAVLGGLVTRRVQLQFSAQASTGQVGLTGDSSGGFNTYHASASLNYAFSRYANAGLVYSYYHHRFGEAARITPGFPGEVGRQSLRAQLNVWAPLFHRSRRANATR